ncbi:zinc finger protein 695-like, partial [Anneissia japonica]|uniref:zinc finger protein 695-like n=1 Tax=Anneissia japonica TaxID=1529436 RepID=UPI0014254DD7
TCSDVSNNEESKDRPNETCLISVKTEYSVIENCHLNLFPVNNIHEKKSMNECNEVEKQFEMSSSSEKNIQMCEEMCIRDRISKFSHLGHMKRHLKIHTGDQPYECEHCGKKFRELGHLQRHLKMHKRETAYECEHCGKKFRLSHDFKKHI